MAFSVGVLRVELFGCIALLVALLFPAGDAVSQVAMDDEGLQRQLNELEKGSVDAQRRALNPSVAIVMRAASSPSEAMKVVEGAIRDTRFEGRRNEATDFQEWKHRSEAMLKSKEMAISAQIHFRYLLLTVRRLSEPDPAAQLPAVLEYVRDFQAYRLSPEFAPSKWQEQKALVDAPMPEAFTVRALHLDRYIAKMENWEMVPSKIPEILEKDVRSVMRQKADPRILDTWDIEIEFKRALSRSDPAASAEFESVEKPRLQWSRAGELIALGRREEALREMLAVIKASPEHPEAKAWINTMRSVLGKPAPAPATPEATRQSPPGESSDPAQPPAASGPG